MQARNAPMVPSFVPSFAGCIAELVTNASNAGATSIAVRVHLDERFFRVIDNGVGMTREVLRSLGSCYTECRGKTFVDIRRYAASTVVESRWGNSQDTYAKIFDENRSPALMKVAERPSRGTTVTVKGFRPWRSSVHHDDGEIGAIRRSITVLALGNEKISFSLRDDLRARMVTSIVKGRDTLELLRSLCEGPIDRLRRFEGATDRGSVRFHGFAGSATRDSRFLFINGRLARCSTIENATSATVAVALRMYAGFLGNGVFLLRIECSRTEYVASIERGEWHAEFFETRSIANRIGSLVIRAFADDLRSPTAEIAGDPSKKGREERNDTRERESELERRAPCKRPKLAEESDKTPSQRTRLSRVAKLDNDFGKRRFKALLPHDASRRMYYFSVGQPEGSPAMFCNEKLARCVELLKRRLMKRASMKRVAEKAENKNGKGRNEMFNIRSARAYDDVECETRMEAEDLPAPNARESERYAEEGGCYECGSEWSNWSYLPRRRDASNHPTRRENCAQLGCPKYYDFLPVKLNKLLQGGRDKLRKQFSATTSYDVEAAVRRHQNVEARPCRVESPLRELILERKCLRSAKIIGRINDEFIATVMVQDDKTLLVLVDQHAAHERIRYEVLLKNYRAKKKSDFVSVALKEPIELPDLSSNHRHLLLANAKLLFRFGLRVSPRGRDTLMVREVPKCFANERRPRNKDGSKLASAVRRLLSELAESLTTAKGVAPLVPLSIHAAVATEACHGAIKFGDPMTTEQCEVLLDSLKDTAAPNRCAHGRPSCVPLMELTELRKRRFDRAKGDKDPLIVMTHTWTSANNRVRKVVIESGSVSANPTEGSVCALRIDNIQITGIAAEDFNERFATDHLVGEPDKIVTIGCANSDVDDCLERAISRMTTVGERSLVRVTLPHPEERGSESAISCEITLKSCDERKPFWEWTPEEKYAAALRHKEAGVALFKAGRHVDAFRRFGKACKGLITLEPIEDLELDEATLRNINSLRLTLYNNMAGCHLHRKNFEHVIALCDKVLNRDADNVKALYRRGVAYGGLLNFEKAVADLGRVVQLEPQNSSARKHFETYSRNWTESKRRANDMVRQMFKSLH